MTEKQTQPAVAKPLLRLDFGDSAIFLQPDEAGILRDELRVMQDPAAAFGTSHGQPHPSKTGEMFVYRPF